MYRTFATELTVAQPPCTAIYDLKRVAFACQCGTSLTLERRSGADASGLFCHGCHSHYWIVWETGEMRKEDKQPYSYVPDSRAWIASKGDLVREVNRTYPGVTYISEQLFNARASENNEPAQEKHQ